MVMVDNVKAIMWRGNTGSVDASDLGFRVGTGPRALVVQGKTKRVTFYYQRTRLNPAGDEALYDLYESVDGVYKLTVYND